VADARGFEIVCDLMAEGWAKGVSRLQIGGLAPVRFDTKRAQPNGSLKYRPGLSVLPARLAPPASKPATFTAATAH
jgi:hypothetical protein